MMDMLHMNFGRFPFGGSVIISTHEERTDGRTHGNGK
jgi:hypothetical protein